MYSFRAAPKRAEVWRGPVVAKLPWSLPEPLKELVQAFAADNGLSVNRALSELVLIALEVGPLVELVAPNESVTRP